MKDKLIWFDARNLKEENNILTLVGNLRFKSLLINAEMHKMFKKQRGMQIIIDVKNEQEFEGLPKEAIIYSDNLDILDKARELGYATAFFTWVREHDEMEQAWRSGYTENFLIVQLNDETNIPVELLIARLQKTDTKLFKVVNNVQDAEIAFGVMEKGCDGVLVQTDKIDEIIAFDKLMGKEEMGMVDIVKSKVVDVQHIGMGYRVCIDTTTLMTQNEGMIIGSTSNGGLLISSETHDLPYMELRPFRVNAGAVHSYVTTPNNMTAYLSEIKSGSKVLCVDTNGNTREVSVGRAKTELRPLLKIEAEYDGIIISAIVQDDWHIRIFGADGLVRNASKIEKGDELLAYVCRGGRHVGINIEESLNEK